MDLAYSTSSFIKLTAPRLIEEANLLGEASPETQHLQKLFNIFAPHEVTRSGEWLPPLNFADFSDLQHC